VEGPSGPESGAPEEEGRAVSDQLDERARLELKFRQEWAAEAKAERELREKILKWFYAIMAVVTVFVVALFFF
jgi:type VI protein secretion system component VasF